MSWLASARYWFKDCCKLSVIYRYIGRVWTSVIQRLLSDCWDGGMNETPLRGCSYTRLASRYPTPLQLAKTRCRWRATRSADNGEKAGCWADRQLSTVEVYIRHAPSAKTLISGRLAAADEGTAPRRGGGGGIKGGQAAAMRTSNDQTTGRSSYDSRSSRLGGRKTDWCRQMCVA